MRKKKPMGSAWDEFVARWNTATHAEKLALAENYQVTYDTAKHWISEAGQARPKIAACPRNSDHRRITGYPAISEPGFCQL